MPKKEIAASLLVVMVLAGCNLTRTVRTDRPQVAEEQIWLRTDGKSSRGNPALAAQFQSDTAACTVQGGLDRNCMTKRAYILVPKSQAEATAAKLRSANGGT